VIDELRFRQHNPTYFWDGMDAEEKDTLVWHQSPSHDDFGLSLERKLIVSQALEAILPKMSEMERKVLDFYYLQGMEPREIADRLNTTVNGADGAIKRVNAKLRQYGVEHAH